MIGQIISIYNVNESYNFIIEYQGNSYSIIIGKYINGGYCCIPRLNIGCELASYDDILWNTTSLKNAIKNDELAQMIAETISEFNDTFL